MTLITDTWHQLVQRRLLPVAVLLLAALVAVPFLLAKDPEPVPAPPVAPLASDDSKAASLETEPIVTLVEEGAPARRRRVLGARKNPFEPAPAPRAARAQVNAGEPANGGSAPTSGGDDGSKTTTGGSAPSAPSPGGTAPKVAPPVGTEPEEPKPVYELHSLTVRFGSSSDERLEKMNLARLKALPSVEDPILVYLGLGKDAKTAVFLVDAAVEPQGDGTCEPNPATCETIHLRVGDTEFFDVKDEETGRVVAQYQLDLLEIKRRTTTSASKAKAARAKASEAGRKVLRARQAASGPLRYRYDVKSGTVRKLDRKAFKAAVARVAKAATGGFDIEG